MAESLVPTPMMPAPAAGGPMPAFSMPTGAPSPVVDPYGDDKKLLDYFKRRKEEAWDHRFVYERAWWRILLYDLGRQWIYYDNLRGQWVDKRMAKWIPRPVTNKIGETVATIRSVFQSVQLQVKCRPEGNDPKNVSTAETADKLEPAIAWEHKMPQVQRESDFWLITLGNVFWLPWWDKRAGVGAKTVPFEQCQTCGTVSAPDEIDDARGVCPKCGTPSTFTQVPSEMPVTRGCGRTDVCSPFEIAIPPGFQTFEDISHLFRVRWRTKQYYESNYPELAKTLRFDKMPAERSLQLLRAIGTTTDIGNSPISLGTSGTVSTLGEGISEFELWMKPCRDYPEGLLLRVVGDAQPQVIRDASQSLPGPLPYRTQKGDPLWPWLHCGYEQMGGRVWHRSPIEPLLSKQDQINQVDSLIQLIVQRTANPVWLEPKGAEVKKFTGEPGLVVQYNPLLAAGNAKPERIAGEGIQPSLMALRQGFIADLEALAGTSDVLKGQRPPNIEAFSALQLLVERSQSRFAPVLAERGRLYREWYGLALELERAYGPEERVWSVLGPNQTWTVQTFKRAELQGAIQILIEDGSQTPKTSLGKRAAIEQLNQLGFINKQDPEQQYTVLKTFGQTDLLPSLDNDVKSSLREQDEFERWATSEDSMPLMLPALPGVPPAEGGNPADTAPSAPGPPQAAQPPEAASAGASPAGDGSPPAPQAPAGPPMPLQTQQFVTPFPMVVQYWHNDAVHNGEHRKWANSDNARQIFDLRPDLVQTFTIHMQAHDFSALQKMALQQAMQMQVLTPPGGAAGGGQAMRNSNRESGNPGDVPRGSSENVQGRGPE